MNQLRAFDVRSDCPDLNFARVTVAHRPPPYDEPVRGPVEIGFRVDAGVGETPNGYLQSDPAATKYPTLSRYSRPSKRPT